LLEDTAKTKTDELNKTLQETLTRQHEVQIAAENTKELSLKLQNDLDASREQTGQLTTQLDEKNTSLIRREEALSGQQARIETLVTQLGIAETEKNRSHNELLVQQKSVTEALTALNTERERALALENAAKTKTDQLNQTLHETLVRQHESQIASGKTKLLAQKLQSELDAAREHTGQLTTQLDEKITRLISREEALTEQQARIESLIKQQGMAEAEKKHIQDKLLEQQKSAAEAVATINTEREFAKWLENEWNTASALVETRTSQLEAAKKEAQIAADKADELTQELQRELNTARDHTGHLTMQLGEKSAAFTSLEETLSAQRQSAAETKARANDLQTTLDAVHADNHRHWQLANNLQATLTETEARANNLQTALDAVHAENHRHWQLANNLQATLTETEARANKLQATLAAVHAANHRHWKLATKLQATLSTVHASDYNNWELAEAREQQIHDIYKSHSWRITAPLRWCGRNVKMLKEQGFIAISKSVGKKLSMPVVRRTVIFVTARPALRKRLIQLICRLGLFNKARNLFWRMHLQTRLVPAPTQAASRPISDYLLPPAKELPPLTPRARQIYTYLKTAIEQCKKENR
jgi:chromosome segregation ATPase